MTRRPLLLPCFLAALPAALAQTAPAPSAAPPDQGLTPAEITVMNPFDVSENKDEGYAARDTLAGSRLNTSLADVASQTEVMTPAFMADIAGTSVEDMLRYSIDVENNTEFSSATANGGDFTAGVINYRSGDRIRGLASPGTTHDFFSTVIPSDAFNLERVTIAEGPNAILFGVGNPGGIIDSSFSKAQVQRASGKTTYLTDQYGSARGTLDVNIPVIKDMLAFRLAAERQNLANWRRPEGNDDRRMYGTFTFQPFKSTVIRAYLEDVRLDDYIPRNTRIGDSISPWLLAGSPGFNNSLTNPSPNPSATDPVFTRNTSTKTILVTGASAPGAPFGVYGSAGTATTTPIYSVNTIGPGAAPYETGSDQYVYSLGKRYAYVSPLDVAVSGNGTRNLLNGKIKGASIEQRIGSDLFLSAAFNEENDVNPATDFLRGIAAGIQADANEYLPDRKTPNPNYGKYYVESNSQRITEFWNNLKESRAMGTYTFDAAKHSATLGPWFGRWTLSGMVQRTDSISVQQDFAPRDVPAGLPAATVLANYGTSAYNTMVVRSYLSNPRDASSGKTFYFNLPFDPLGAPYTLPDGSTLYGLNNPYGGTTDPSITNNVLEGRVIALQGNLLKNHLAFTAGWRDDTTEQASLTLPQLGGNAKGAYEPWYDAPTPKTFSTFTHGQSRTIGAVVHVIPEVSLYYNRSGTFAPPSSALDPNTGKPYAGSTGTGYDYGIMLNFLHNRVSLRVNRYENTIGPTQSSYRNFIIPDVQNIEQSLFDLADAGTIPPYQAPAAYNANLTTYTYDVVANAVARGYEFELVGNVTRNWRVMFNGAKADSVESDIGSAWFNFISQRMPYWAKYATMYDPSKGSANTISAYVQDLIPSLLLVQQSDGQENEQNRSLRLNLVTRYGFDGTLGPKWLKGVFVGSGVAWRARSVIGYEGTQIANPYASVFPGLGSTVTVPSVKSPLYGRSVTSVEGFVGYERKIWKGLLWRTQLNVRNLFNDTSEIQQRANTSGMVTVFTLPAPPLYTLTTSLEY